MKKIFLLLGLSMFIWSCEKAAKLENDEYLVFGKFNGFCASNCTTLFKIEGGKLYADDMDRYLPGDDLVFESDPLPAEKYEEALKLYQDIPDKLKETTEMSFGCPGCVDQDIILLRYFDGADKKEWQVDSDIESNPEYLQDYAAEVLEVIEKLNN